MYVHRVTLKNIRSFESLDFEFDRPGLEGNDQYRGWNVIAGDNASGKSTLLRAVVLAIAGPEYVRALTARSPLADWLRRGADEGLILVDLKPDADDKTLRGGNKAQGPISCQLKLMRRGLDVDLIPLSSPPKSAFNGPWSGQPYWFSAAYGPFRRLYGTSPDAAGQMAKSDRISRHGTLFFEDATLQQATNWLKDLKFKELEGRSGALLTQVKALVGAEFLRHGYTLDVDSGGLWLVDQAGQRTTLAEMSDGYRSALALLIDMLWHMNHVFGAEFRIEEGKVLHPGVVLIDEVDSHLHPAWQRLIGDWLKVHLPNVQFITTSHSAFVAQATDVGGLYHLPSPGKSDGPKRIKEADRQLIIRQTPDEILRGPVFGMAATRSPTAVAERQELSKLTARKRARPLEHQDQLRLAFLERVHPED